MSSSITNSGDVSVNINQIATDLNNKVDRDILNLSNTGKDTICSFFAPDYSNLTNIYLGALYQAPVTGVVFADFVTTNGGSVALSVSKELPTQPPSGMTVVYNAGSQRSDIINDYFSIFIIIPKGYYYYFSNAGIESYTNLCFAPLQGVSE